MKDFYDIWLLSRTLTIDGAKLARAIRETFDRRTTPVPREWPVALTSAFFADASHVKQWAAFTKRIGEQRIASDLPRVVQEIGEFLMPVSAAVARSSSFMPSWKPGGPWGDG